MKIVLTGATGLLGKYLLNELSHRRELAVLALSKQALQKSGDSRFFNLAIDFKDFDRLKNAVEEFAPDWICHAGGIGNVDYCEKNPQEARLANLESSLQLMELAKKLNSKWLTFSSNAVYDGDHAPYSEADSANPLSLYGRLKAQVDEATRKFEGHWVIYRPTVSYGWNFSFGRPNPVTGFLAQLEKGNPIRAVTDQFENPLYAGDSARILTTLLESNFQGEINVGGGERVSRFDWAQKIAGVFGISKDLILPAKMSDFPSLLKRPTDTSFNTQKLKNLGLSHRPMEECLLEMKAQRL